MKVLKRKQKDDIPKETAWVQELKERFAFGTRKSNCKTNMPEKTGLVGILDPASKLN